MKLRAVVVTLVGLIMAAFAGSGPIWP